MRTHWREAYASTIAMKLAQAIDKDKSKAKASYMFWNKDQSKVKKDMRLDPNYIA